MIKAPFALAVLLLASCGQSGTDAAAPAGQQPGNASAEAPTPSPTPAAAAKGRKVEEKTDTLEFSYAWPGEAAAIPALNRQFEEELGRDRVEKTTAAREDKAALGSGFFAHSYSKEWKLAGSTPGLLSLVGTTSSFTGGMHPNTHYDALLWDRGAGRLIAASDMFTGGLSGLNQRYCKGLDALRTEKRGEALPASPDDFMTACPPLADQPMVPADTNGNGRFDTIQVWLAPSVAGPHAEGDYQVELKVDAATLAALKPGYRAAFEAGS